jgi:hypothetical protein
LRLEKRYLFAECGQLSSPGERIRIDARDEAETAKLLEFYDGGLKAPCPENWDLWRPSLHSFYLLSFPLHCSLPEELARMEETLSPGSLREIVHATRLTAAVYDAQSVEQKRAAAAALLAWLDQRPEIQRHWMAMQLYSWCCHNKGLGVFAYVLVDEVIRRMPEEYGMHKDHQQYSRKQYLLDHPGADKYWKPPTVTENRRPPREKRG